jgi:Cupin-like domain
MSHMSLLTDTAYASVRAKTDNEPLRSCSSTAAGQDALPFQLQQQQQCGPERSTAKFRMSANENLRLYHQFPIPNVDINELEFVPRFDVGHIGPGASDSDILALVECLRSNQPFILHQAARDWTATREWSFDMFADMKNRQVTVSMSIEECTVTRKTRMPIAKFIDTLHDEKVDFAYLKEANVCDFPELESHLHFDEWTNAQFGNSLLWIGTHGCVTGLHDDDENNVVLQAYGHKRFLLTDPSRADALRRNNKYDRGTCCYDVDLEQPGQYPLVATLQAGDLLFFPKYWGHQVRALDKSISVNHFYSNLYEHVVGSIRRGFFDLLHTKLGWWQDCCVCHEPSVKSVVPVQQEQGQFEKD